MTAQELQNIERAFRTGLSIGFGFTPANYTPEEINKTWNSFKKSIEGGHFKNEYSANIYNDQLVITVPVKKLIEMVECDGETKVENKELFLKALCENLLDETFASESSVADMLFYVIESMTESDDSDFFEYTLD